MSKGPKSIRFYDAIRIKSIWYRGMNRKSINRREKNLNMGLNSVFHKSKILNQYKLMYFSHHVKIPIHGIETNH